MKKHTGITNRVRQIVGKTEILKISSRGPIGKRVLFPFYDLGLGDKVFFEVILRKYREANQTHYLIGLENRWGLSMTSYPMPPDEVWRITWEPSLCLEDNRRLRRTIQRMGIDKIVLCHERQYDALSSFSIDTEYRHLWTELRYWKRHGVYPCLIVPPYARGWAADLLQRYGIHQPPVTVHLRSQSWDTWRNLDFDKYLEVIDWIIEEHDIPVIIVGREEANPKANRPGVLDVSKDELTVQQSAAIIERSSFFMGTDTGPTHLAAALGVPVVYTEMTGAAPGPFAPANNYIWVPRQRLERGTEVRYILAAIDNMLGRVSRPNTQTVAEAHLRL